MVDMSVKMDVLGSIFSGKMVFENGKCRTPIIPILIGREAFFNDSGVPVNTETPLLYPQEDSNLYRQNRNLKSYPLDYGGKYVLQI